MARGIQKIENKGLDFFWFFSIIFIISFILNWNNPKIQKFSKIKKIIIPKIKKKTKNTTNLKFEAWPEEFRKF